MIRLYNTMSRQKENLTPIRPPRLKLFVCGPTVYDDSHIGHGRTYIAFDCIARYLKYQNYSLFYLQNITDIDDKIIKRAKEKKISPSSLAKKYEKRYLEDMKALKVENVTLHARASEHIPEIIDQIQRLIDIGAAYITLKGVYFQVETFDEFGKLSNRKMDDQVVHRITPDSEKKNPRDFALWKNSSDSPSWESPWGSGRPGWHIEDTSITEEYLGTQYDIHGGGLDLIFPHHDAEIAQMETLSKQPLVRYWMHTGFLNVKGEKMSKSLGNFITIRQLLEEWEADVFRLFVLSTHYRSPIDFSSEALEQSQNSLKRIKKFLEKIYEIKKDADGEEGIEELVAAKESFISAMDDDFNTPQALAVIFKLTRKLNGLLKDDQISPKFASLIINQFSEWEYILGIQFLPNIDKRGPNKEILEVLLDVRQKLREKKDWELSDDIRNKLKELDIIIED